VLLGRRESGGPCLACCHCDPAPDKRKKIDGWMDGSVRQYLPEHNTHSRISPSSVPRVWSDAGLDELSGWGPLVRIQLRSGWAWGRRPQREDWKVHSLSAGQEPPTLVVTCTSSTEMLPWVPPTSASRMNWGEHYFIFIYFTYI